MVFNFCLLDAEYTTPFPINLYLPVWLFILWWTVNAASTHHLLSYIHPNPGLVQGHLCFVGTWERGWLSAHCPSMVLSPSFLGMPPWWVCRATPVFPEIGTWSRWCGRSVHCLCWAFVPISLPRIGGLRRSSLRIFCICVHIFEDLQHVLRYIDFRLALRLVVKSHSEVPVFLLYVDYQILIFTVSFSKLGDHLFDCAAFFMGDL